jgi:hypothetical protein
MKGIARNSINGLPGRNNYIKDDGERHTVGDVLSSHGTATAPVGAKGQRPRQSAMFRHQYFKSI